MEDSKINKILSDTYNEGIISGLNLANKSLQDFINIKESKHNGMPHITRNELETFMETTIELYKKTFSENKQNG